MNKVLRSEREYEGIRPAAVQFGTLLRQYRTRRRVTQSDLGRSFRATQCQVSMMESARRPPPGLEAIDHIATCLQLPPIERQRLRVASVGAYDDDAGIVFLTPEDVAKELYGPPYNYINRSC